MPPARAARVDAGKQFGAEAERKRVDLDPAPAPDEIMAEFVDEDDRGS